MSTFILLILFTHVVWNVKFEIPNLDRSISRHTEFSRHVVEQRDGDPTRAILDRNPKILKRITSLKPLTSPKPLTSHPSMGRRPHHAGGVP